MGTTQGKILMCGVTAMRAMGVTLRLSGLLSHMFLAHAQSKFIRVNSKCARFVQSDTRVSMVATPHSTQGEVGCLVIMVCAPLFALPTILMYGVSISSFGLWISHHECYDHKATKFAFTVTHNRNEIIDHESHVMKDPCPDACIRGFGAHGSGHLSFGWDE